MASPSTATDVPDPPSVAAARQTLALLDEQAASLRAGLVKLRQSLAAIQQDLSESRAAQLREANQRLVLSAMQADSIAARAVANLAELNLSYQHDVLTGMPNRALLLERLENAIVAARQQAKKLAVLFIDLDHFKVVNDSLGHAGGDEALKLVAQRLHAALHGFNTVCRYGGDEFLAMLPEISSAAHAAQVASELLAALAAPAEVSGLPLHFSASIGISLYPDDGEDVSALIARADAAMYRCKHGNRGGFHFHAAGEVSGTGEAPPPILADKAATAVPGLLLRDLRDANEKLVIAALDARASEDQAKEAHRQQLKFIAMVAHELRNPLTPLRIAASLLFNPESGQSDMPVERLQTIVDEQVTYMTRLVEDLLDGSRASVGKLRLECHDVDLRDILEQVVAAGRPGVEARRQHFRMRLPAGPLVVHGDPLRLVQVFHNLLGNACKYTPEGGKIALSLSKRKRAFVITLRDNGIGISAEVLPSIFELFVQDERALSHSDNGLGIGLSVVRDLVQAHGGTVVGHSEGSDRGSEFVVTLPRP